MIERGEYSFWFLALVRSVTAWGQLQFAAVAGGYLSHLGIRKQRSSEGRASSCGRTFLLSQTPLEMPSQRCLSWVTLVKLTLRCPSVSTAGNLGSSPGLCSQEQRCVPAVRPYVPEHQAPSLYKGTFFFFFCKALRTILHFPGGHVSFPGSPSLTSVLQKCGKGDWRSVK